MSSPLGFAIVGTGMIAGYHAQAIAQTPGAKLVGVVSRSPDKGPAFAAQHGIPVTTSTLEEMVARPDVHVVTVTTPSGAHLRLVLASACVKWHRTTDYYKTAWKGTWALDGGGALMNQAIHGVDLLQWFAGLPVEVTGRIARRVHTGIEADDTTVATLQFPDGALGTIEASTAVWPGWSRRIELCGEHGSIALEDDAIVKWEFARPEPGDDDIRAARQANALGSGAGNPAGISIAGHLRQFTDLVESVRGNRAPAIDAAEGRKAVALIHAIYESAKSGRTVRV